MPERVSRAGELGPLKSRGRLDACRFKVAAARIAAFKVGQEGLSRAGGLRSLIPLRGLFLLRASAVRTSATALGLASVKVSRRPNVVGYKVSRQAFRLPL